MGAEIIPQSEVPVVDDRPGSPLTTADLERILHAVDPAVRLVVPRILRRVIKQARRLPGFLYRVPHRKSYLISREMLLEIVDPEECGGSLEDLPEKVILLAQPDPQRLAEIPRAAVLTQYWRLLFHARVHWAVQRCLTLGFLSEAVIGKRIHQLGGGVFEEIRAVLQQENFLLPPRDDPTVYEEFAALFFELKYFAWQALPAYFPALDDVAATAVLEQDVDAAGLFEATRPPGTPEPVDPVTRTPFDSRVGEAEKPAAIEAPTPPASYSKKRFRRWMRKAQEPAKRGNVVGAACYRAKALRDAPPALAGKIRAALHHDLQQLIVRLQAALELPRAAPPTWHESLRALADHTADGYWTAEARLLYDLQKVCLDHEREIYTVNFWGWLRSFGRRPMRRVLSAQRELLLGQHLRRAERRLALVRLADAQRRQLGELLRGASRQVESRFRQRFRPLMRRALDAVGLRPQNLPEDVARDKLIEELLDRADDRGFLAFGDLRDALSRNHLKLPDCRGAGEIVFGDPLLKADRRLGAALEGVYRPAEFYLRWMQRLTALAFGTRTGRLLTLLIAVPFGGSYLIHKFLAHVSEQIFQEGRAFENPFSILLWGLFFCGLVNFGRFRRGVAASLKTAFRFLNRGLFQPLWRAIQSHVVQVILHSRAFRLVFRFLIKPAAWTTVVWLLFPPEGIRWQTTATTAVLIFCAANLVLNSRIGRTLEEVVADAVVQTWQRYGLRLITGLFWLVVDFFKSVLETIERLMYTVDEWLRFRRGDQPRRLALKGTLGALWFFAAYLIRFCVNLLIEPQINPIKHFPVVTVSHKLLWPLVPALTGLLETHFSLEKVAAGFTAGLMITCIPGIFGFLVWELKENWRLYAANRPPGLQPAVIGTHGENLGRLLRTGFHSGTVPKLFARLRRAQRKARKTGNWRAARKHFLGLQHVEQSLRRFLQREFLALWNASPLPLPDHWAVPGEGRGEGGRSEGEKKVETRNAELDVIHLASQRVRFSLTSPGRPQDPLVIVLEVLSGWIVADVVQSGWADRLPKSQADLFSAALLGFYKTAGVDLVRQQIASCFRAPMPPYDIQAHGLRLWTDATFEASVFYTFDDQPVWQPEADPNHLPVKFPPLPRKKILFREFIFPWKDWVSLWTRKGPADSPSLQTGEASS